MSVTKEISQLNDRPDGEFLGKRNAHRKNDEALHSNRGKMAKKIDDHGYKLK